MNRKVKKSEKDSLEILREYLTYRDDDRDALLKRIRELEIELRRMEMARDAYDEVIGRYCKTEEYKRKFGS